MHNADSVIRSNRGGDRSFTAEKLRAEALYVIDLIEVLRTRTAGLRRWAIMQAIRRKRIKAGVPIPDGFEDGVESAFHQHCVDADVYKRGSMPPRPALFHWPLGKDGGIWALKAEQADAWMRERSMQASDDLFSSRAS
jgi:hypothetical protein